MTPVAVLLAIALAAVPRPLAPDAAETIKLENGLGVVLAPVPAATSAALVVLSAIGEDHDPRGASGVVHLVEHLYASAGRTVEEFARLHPRGWNAQTGARYTPIAPVFAPSELEAELKNAASRMAGLEPAAAEVDREKGRILAELHNMYEAVPSLALWNRAGELVRPAPSGGRKGGRLEDIAKIGRNALLDRLRRFYKPTNAVLAVAGPFRADRIRRRIEAPFSEIPAGESAPEPAEPGPPSASAPRSLRPGSSGSPFPPQLCLAFRAPAPGSPDFAAFLVLAARLAAGAGGFRGGTLSVA